MFANQINLWAIIARAHWLPWVTVKAPPKINSRKADPAQLQVAGTHLLQFCCRGILPTRQNPQTSGIQAKFQSQPEFFLSQVGIWMALVGCITQSVLVCLYFCLIFPTSCNFWQHVERQNIRLEEGNSPLTTSKKQLSGVCLFFSLVQTTEEHISPHCPLRWRGLWDKASYQFGCYFFVLFYILYYIGFV